ncbi:SGNH/GDSL hydrolase family protein [bacterium]|nr:SGNH/GDSL hydrolase family protein [bacterium]
MNLNIQRRDFLAASASSLALASSHAFAAQIKESATTTSWHDVKDWGVEGKGWAADQTDNFYDRLPNRAKGTVREAVWNLSRHSAGMLTRFRTNASEIWIDHEVTSAKLSMPHMPATGVSGIDLYATDPDGNWRWLAVSRPTETVTRTKLIASLTPEMREYTAYLPLYNGTKSLKIGVPEQAIFEPIAPREDKAILFYGTSITHGACASRPGMPHPAILGRRLHRPVINLGFSGNGKMEQEVGEFLCEIDPLIYVIDCLPNMRGPEVAQRAMKLIEQLRNARPDTPILLVEDRTYAHAPFLPSLQKRHEESRRELKKAYESLRSLGHQKIAYLPGEQLLGKDRDDTTDGSHPNDLGFYRQANAMEPLLRQLGA